MVHRDELWGDRVTTPNPLIVMEGGLVRVDDSGNIRSGEGCCCGDCTVEDTCWIIEFDLEFLSLVFWETGMGTEWLPYTGNQVLWVDVDDNTNDRRTCEDGVAADEANPGPPGWLIVIPGAFNATGNVEAGDCQEGVSMFLQSDFATDPAGWYPLALTEGVNTLSLTEDLTGATPPGSATQEVIRGTITITRTSPTAKGDCGCP